jgi:hypothetical protein
MMFSMFKPLNEQFDDGLGTLASAFFEGARLIGEGSDRNPFAPRTFPECYLLRHAVELYLKSLMVIVWRTYAIPNTLPEIVIGKGKSVSVDRVHGVQLLFDRLRQLCEMHKSKMQERDPQLVEWDKPLIEAICAIDELDQRSDFFRYPVSKNPSNDKIKSPMQLETPQELLERSRSEPQNVMAFVLVDENKHPINAFSLQNDHLHEIRAKLKIAAESLRDYHAWFDARVVNNI